MNSSIRKFLLINLLFAITITTTLTAIGNYYLDQQDIQEHLDTIMAVSALSYQALLGNDIHKRPISSIQKSLNLIAKQLELYTEHNSIENVPPDYYLNKFNFQIWDNNNNLLLHSVFSPDISLLSKKDGFSDMFFNDEKWRIFTAKNPKAGIHTVLAERYDTRNELGHRIAQDDLYIMLLTFPLSGLLIWLIIGKGLDSITRVTMELSNRHPNRLDPVSIKATPEEIQPLIHELNKLFHRVQEGFEREKRFAADAAHELKTPLAAIKAQAQVALKIDDLDEKNKALEKLITSVNRSTHIVQQLLILSRLVPETETMQDVTNIDLPVVTREILAMLATEAIDKSIDLEFIVKEEIPMVTGNTTAIGILIRNLVDNAIRYTNNNGKVTVRLYTKKDSIVFEVQDNGPGIAKALQKRVFERFFRIVGNKSRGSGLGLAIVHQIAQLHNATIKLSSPIKGKGLIVSVHFKPN